MMVGQCWGVVGRIDEVHFFGRGYSLVTSSENPPQLATEILERTHRRYMMPGPIGPQGVSGKRSRAHVNGDDALRLL
jgi:hypothetical protein